MRKSHLVHASHSACRDIASLRGCILTFQKTKSLRPLVDNAFQLVIGCILFHQNTHSYHYHSLEKLKIVTSSEQTGIYMVELAVNNPLANAGDTVRHRFDPQVRKIPWRRTRQSLKYSCLENLHRQRSLAGYSPQSHRLDMTEVTLAHIW